VRAQRLPLLGELVLNEAVVADLGLERDACSLERLGLALGKLARPARPRRAFVGP
jgi:hypothetical protein